MSPGAASHGHPFVISLCLFFPSASLYTPPSLPLSVSPFAPASPLRRPNPLYTQQTPLPPSIYPSDADDYSALVSRKRTLSVTILRLTFARTHENSIDALAPRFSLLAFLRDGCLSPFASPSFGFLSVCLFLSLSPLASPCLKRRARFWRQRNHHRPVLRRLIIGESGGGRGEVARGRRGTAVVRGCARMASSRFMALGDTTLPSADSTIPGACGGTRRISHSPWPFSPACRCDSSFFFSF